MAGYGGYFLQGLSSGLQSGFNMGQMKWQQNEKKKLQKKQDDMAEASSVFNNMVAQLGEDGSYSEDDMMKINTSYMALGFETKDMVDGTYKAIQAMDKKTIEQNYQWFDLVLESTAGMKSGDAQEIWDTVRPFVSGEEGLRIYEAMESIGNKKADIAANAPPAPEDIWGQAGTLPQDIRPDYLRSKGVDIPQSAVTPDQPPTELGLQADTQKKLDYAYNTGNASHFNAVAKAEGVDTTFDTYKQKYEKPEVGGGTTPEKFRATSLTILEKYRNNALNADSLEGMQSVIKDYEEAGYDPAPLIEKANEQTWANSQTGYLSNLLNAIKATTNEKGWLKSSEVTPQEVSNQIKKNAPASEVYEEFRKEYMKYRDILEKAGVDISQFPKLKPLSEIEKVGFIEGLKTLGGVGWGQYKSIYY